MSASTMHRVARPSVARPAAPSDAALRRTYRRLHLRRRRHADLLTVVSWVSVAAAVSLWLADGGLAHVTTLGGALTAAGIVTGLAATDLVVVMLLLAARIGYVDRAIGHDRAVAAHSTLGAYALVGLLAHAWFLVCGYAASDGSGLWGELTTMLAVRDLLLGVVGLGLLALLGLTSVGALRRLLPYEVWHGLHLVMYIAVAFSIPHQFSQSGVLAAGTWQRWYWAVLLSVTGFALLTYRVFLPLFSSLEHRLVVTRVVREADDVVSIEMTGRNLPALDVEAGQFLGWRFLAHGLWWHQHPFSVSAAPTRDTLRITVRALGRGTAGLMSVRPGTKVMIEGPYGLFTRRTRTTPALTLVGLGIGVAPIRALLEATEVVPGRATVILRAHAADQLYLVGEIDALCRAKGARLITLVGPRARNRLGETSWLPESHYGLTLADLVPGVADSDVYVCGPQAAADLVVADALAAGTPGDQIHNERFAW